MTSSSTNRFIFAEFIKQLLEWLDTEYPQQTWYVVQNLLKDSRHKCRFLPAYSPMFNLIETFFSKLKNYVRRNPKEDKTSHLELIKEAGKTISSENCQGWTKHCVEISTKLLKEKMLHLTTRLYFRNPLLSIIFAFLPSI